MTSERWSAPVRHSPPIRGWIIQVSWDLIRAVFLQYPARAELRGGLVVWRWIPLGKRGFVTCSNMLPEPSFCVFKSVPTYLPHLTVSSHHLLFNLSGQIQRVSPIPKDMRKKKAKERRFSPLLFVTRYTNTNHTLRCCMTHTEAAPRRFGYPRTETRWLSRSPFSPITKGPLAIPPMLLKEPWAFWQNDRAAMLSGIYARSGPCAFGTRYHPWGAKRKTTPDFLPSVLYAPQG